MLDDFSPSLLMLSSDEHGSVLLQTSPCSFREITSQSSVTHYLSTSNSHWFIISVFRPAPQSGAAPCSVHFTSVLLTFWHYIFILYIGSVLAISPLIPFLSLALNTTYSSSIRFSLLTSKSHIFSLNTFNTLLPSSPALLPPCDRSSVVLRCTGYRNFNVSFNRGSIT